jgi:hypothetical protein
MRYALLIYPGDAANEVGRLSDELQGAILREYQVLVQERGILAAGQLQPAESATTVRALDGKMLTTDGPFADTKEVLGGVVLLEADNLDRALELAARVPALRFGGAVEVRPLVER